MVPKNIKKIKIKKTLGCLPGSLQEEAEMQLQRTLPPRPHRPWERAEGRGGTVSAAAEWNKFETQREARGAEAESGSVQVMSLESWLRSCQPWRELGFYFILSGLTWVTLDTCKGSWMRLWRVQAEVRMAGTAREKRGREGWLSPQCLLSLRCPEVAHFHRCNKGV